MKRTKVRLKERFRHFFAAFAKKVRANKISFSIYVLMGLITVAVIVFAALDGNYESIFTAVLSLILFLIPTFVEESFRIKLPMVLEIIAVLFVFCANILGEIAEFYTRIPFWDDMLHYVSGFIFAAFGFSLVDILNRRRNVEFHLSPIFMSLMALCFSVTVGVVWEFFEFSVDYLLHMDMQKDTVVTNVFSALMNENGQSPFPIREITETVIKTADGSTYTVKGHLDIGLFDTMKDLFVDFAGAFLFCTFGYFYSSNSRRGRIAKQFVPRVTGEGEE